VSCHVYSQKDVGGGRRTRVSRRGVLAWFVWGLVVTAVAGGTADGATYYLDANGGNDGWPGTSLLPWRSLAKAQAAAKFGDTILMRNGNYGPFVADRSFFAPYPESDDVPLPAGQLWVTYQAIPGQDHVDVDYIEYKFGGQLYTVAHAFKGINLTKPKGRCVFAWGVVGLLLEDITLSGTTNVDLLATAMSYHSTVELKGLNNDITISGCEIQGGYRGIYADGVNNNVRISGCNIHNTGVDKIMYASGTNILIENCRLHGPPLLPNEHPDCIQFYTAADTYGPSARATNITIRGNMMYDHPSQGVWTDGSYLVNVVFENNLMYNLGNYEWRVYSVHGGLIRNNTIVGGAGRNTGIIVYGSDQNSNITVVNNIFACPYWGSTAVMDYHDHNVFTDSSADSPGDEESNSYEFPSMEAAIAALFTDAASADYSLATGSKAIDFGDAGSNPGVDLAGAQRDSSPDAGCYEYGSAGAPPEDPPAQDPPAQDPPAEDPPAEDPPAEDPPAEDPPAEDPPAEDPPLDDTEDNFWDDLIQKAKDERLRRQNSPSQVYRRIQELRRRHKH